MSSNNNNNSNNLPPVNSNVKRTTKHVNYIPWEPIRAAVSHVEQQNKNIATPVNSTLETQLYRYQNTTRLSSSPTTTSKENIPLSNRIKPTATVEPFQSAVNIGEILYGVNPLTVTNPTSQTDLNLSSDHQELKFEFERVQDENASLKQQLAIQTEVNAELKKLLVASVGTDFQYRLERLLREKSRSDLEIQNLTNKINDLLDEIEKLTIQCDIHQSKSAASKVLIDELNMHKSVLTVQCNDCSHVIQRLLAERSQIAKDLIQTHSFLSTLNETVTHPNRKSMLIAPKFDLTQLSSYVQALASSVFNYLKQTSSYLTNPSKRQMSIQLELTEAETFALEILQSHTSLSASKNSTSTAERDINEIEQLESMINRLKLINRKKSHERFHLTTRYENLTLNCCRDCSGEIHLV